MKKLEKQEYRKYKITEVRVNGNTKITEIDVRYLSKLEGTIDMGTQWAIERDTLVSPVTYIELQSRLYRQYVPGSLSRCNVIVKKLRIL